MDVTPQQTDQLVTERRTFSRLETGARWGTFLFLAGIKGLCRLYTWEREKKNVSKSLEGKVSTQAPQGVNTALG